MKIETKKLKIVAEYQKYLPALTKEESSNLETSMRVHGQLTPIMVMKDTNFILDGHNRFEKLRKLNIQTALIEIVTTNDPLEWILRNQLTRRNLTELQRDKLLAAQVKRLDKLNAKNKKEETKKLAKEAKISPATLKRIEKQQEVIESLPEPTKKKIEEAGTRRAANEIINKVVPQSTTVKLKNDVLDYRSLLIGIIDGAENLQEDGIKDFKKRVFSIVDEKKLHELIEWLEKEAKRLKDLRASEIDGVRDASKKNVSK